MATPNKQTTRPNDIVIYKEFLATCINHWYWFVGLVVVLLMLVGAYLIRTPKSYTSHASVLIIEDEKTQSSMTKISREFSTMGLAQSTMNVNNEMARFMSQDVLVETARRMNFCVQYWSKKTFRTEVIYGKEVPVEVEFLDADELYRAKLKMHIYRDGRIKLYNFNLLGEEIDGEKIIAVPNAEEEVSLPIGRVRLLPHANYAAHSQVVHIAYLPPLQTGLNIGRTLAASYPNKKTSIIELSYRDQAAGRANDILRTLIEVYNEQWIKDQNSMADATSQFIKERISRLQNELGVIDCEISDYKSTHHITDMNGVDRMYLDQYSKSEMEIASLESQKDKAKHVSQKLKKEKSREMLPTSIGMGNYTLEQQIRDYNNSVMDINTHLSYTSENNPLIGNLDEQIEQMRIAIINGLDNEIETLDISIATKRDQSQAILNRIQSSPDQAMYLLSVERQQKVKESLFLYLLQKQEEIELSQSYASPRSQVLNAPTLDKKTTPNAKKLLLLALIAGIMIPAAVLILIQIFDTSIRTSNDISGELTIPYLGEIPYVKAIKKSRNQLVVNTKNSDRVNEAFRSLRTQFTMQEKKQQQGLVYNITSQNQDSGKTFITLNLSATLAIQGKRVIMIDGDLRHSSLSQALMPQASGLSNYLMEEAMPEQVIAHHPEYDGLDYISAGTATNSPTELLSNGRLETLLQALRHTYDYVLIDCPPIDVVADTHIIESLTDRSLYILRAGKTEKSSLPQLEEEYQSGKHPEMAVILNGVQEPGKWSSKWGYSAYGQSRRFAYCSLLLLMLSIGSASAKAEEIEPLAETDTMAAIDSTATDSIAKRVSPWASGERDSLAFIWYIGVNKSVNEHLPWIDWTPYPFGWGTHLGLAKEWNPLLGWRVTLGYDFNKARRTRTCEERTWYVFHDVELFADLTLDLCDLVAPKRENRKFNAKWMLGAGGLLGFRYPSNVPLSYIYPYDASTHATFGFRTGFLLHYRVHPQVCLGVEITHTLTLDNFSGVTDWGHTSNVVNPDPVSPLDGRSNLMVGLTWTPKPKKKAHRVEEIPESTAVLDSLIDELELIIPEVQEVAIRTLSGSAFIDFPVNETIIYPAYRDNPNELRKLESSIEKVIGDEAVQILSISLHGYASPESPYSNNERLARERSYEIRRYVMDKYNIAPDIISAAYTPEDWAGLRKYVEEKLQQRSYRAEILGLIDTPMDEDEKELKLKKIGGGKPYKELYTIIYPALRHTDYVITYQIEDNKAPKDVKKLIYRHPELLSLGDITREAVSHEEGSAEWYDILQIGVRQFATEPIALYNAGVACLRTHRMRDARTFLTNKLLDDMPEAQKAREVLQVAE